MLIVAEPTGVGEKLGMSHIFSELNLFSSELFKNVVIRVYLQLRVSNFRWMEKEIFVDSSTLIG